MKTIILIFILFTSLTFSQSQSWYLWWDDSSGTGGGAPEGYQFLFDADGDKIKDADGDFILTPLSFFWNKPLYYIWRDKQDILRRKFICEIA